MSQRTPGRGTEAIRALVDRIVLTLSSEDSRVLTVDVEGVLAQLFRLRLNHDGTIIPETVDTMWGTDMTAAFTTEHGQVAVFVAVDHCSAECVGIHAARRGTRFESLEPIRQGVVERFGRVEKNAAKDLSIRHDHGSQYMSHDFQKEIAWLGATSSPAFVRAPEGNGCAERFIRTLKENLLWVQTFRTVEELRLALIEFRQTYNAHWLIERHGYRSPTQFRRDQMDTMPRAA